MTPTAVKSRALWRALPLVLAAGAACRNQGEIPAVSLDTLPSGARLVSNVGTGLWGPQEEWRLVPDLKLGSINGVGPETFGELVDLAVDDFGRIFVLDRQAREVRIFNSAGAHVRSFGREGRGPGEFLDPIALVLSRDASLWVVDPGNARFAVFDTAGRYLESHVRPSNGYAFPWGGGFDTHGRFYDHVFVWGAGAPRYALARFDRSFQVADTVWLPEYDSPSFEIVTANSRTRVDVPFSARLIWRFDLRGFVWHSITDRYRIYQQRLGGDTTRAIEKDIVPIPVTSEERDSALSRLEEFVRRGGKVDPSRIPKTKPVLSTFYVDDAGYLWVRRTASASFDVFDPQGRYLGGVKVEPPGFTPVVFKSRDIYGTVTDPLGVDYLVRVRVQGR
jgi:hypothetical protein